MTESLNNEPELEFGDYDQDSDLGKLISAEDALDYHDSAGQDDFEGLGAPGNAPRNAREAIRVARDMAHNNVFVGIGYCLKTVRGYYGVGAKYTDATASWNHAAHKHPLTSGIDAPRGVPVYWTGGSSGHGHIALSVGGGMCYTTDWNKPGQISLAKIDDITRRWGLKFQGYAWEVNDVIVWKPPVPVGTIHLSNLHGKASNKDVLALKKRLWEKGYRGFLPNNSKFGPGTKRAYAKYQRSLGYSGADANGIPGPISLKKLGFKVLS